MQLVDTHAHLDFLQFNKDREKVINNARKAGLKYIINIGTTLASSRRSVELSQLFDEVYATVGIHPHNASGVAQETVTVLKDLAKAAKVIAIGEIGLDFHYDNSPRKIQQEIFVKQLQLAREFNLPVIIHSREASGETMKILEEQRVKEIGGIMHCFAGDTEMAFKVIEWGMYLAFGGIITFKNAHKTRQVVAEVPLENILIETDCPYLAPVPFRGKRNQPAYVKYVAREIAQIKDIPVEKVARVTTENAERATVEP